MDTFPWETETLDAQADQIERAFLGLAVPVHVGGGEVRRGWVRYRLTPMPGTALSQLGAVAGEVARALGVPEVRLAPGEGDLAVDVPLPGQPHVRLLPLLEALGPFPPLTVLLGLTPEGQPLLFPLQGRETWSLLATGDHGSGKSELLRAAMFSLALTSRASQLQVLGIDIGGRELAVMEALPHAVAELATEEGYALELLSWLVEEVARRTTAGIRRPELVLVLDDLSWLAHADCEPGGHDLEQIWRQGPICGVHVLAAAGLGLMDSLGLRLGKASTIQAVATTGEANGGAPAVGRFDFHSGSRTVRARTAWLSARDMDAGVRLASTVHSRRQEGRSCWS